MSTDIRDTQTDKIVVYKEDDGGATLALWTPVADWRNIRLTKDEAAKLRDALGGLVSVQTSDEKVPMFPLGGHRMITFEDDPPSDPDRIEDREV
jgi:hypothetical protein